MKPEITEYGVYPTNRPIRSTPSAIWISPAITAIVNASAQALRVRCHDDRHRNRHRTRRTRNLRPRPPEHRAKNPTAMAPYSPATAPRPDATPNASATGSPTTAAVTPPNKSPRSVCRS